MEEDNWDGEGTCPTCGREDLALVDILQEESPPGQVALWVAVGPGASRNRADWLRHFREVGYQENGMPALPPAAPLVLWRGATPEHRGGMSWTSSRDAALQFASGWMVQREIGLVWRAVVTPDRLLARIDNREKRPCTEYVVDTDGLAIEPDGLWCRCPVDLEPFRQDAQLALDLHELVHCSRVG